MALAECAAGQFGAVQTAPDRLGDGFMREVPRQVEVEHDVPEELAGADQRYDREGAASIFVIDDLGGEQILRREDGAFGPLAGIVGVEGREETRGGE